MSPRRFRGTSAATAALLVAAVVTACGFRPAIAADSSANKGVSITLTAEWQATSSLLEAAEFFADEGPDVYWKFVEEIWKESEDEGCQEQIYERASKLTSSDEALKVLKLSLGIHKYSPRLEMFRALASKGAATHSWRAEGDEARPMPCCWAEMSMSTASSSSSSSEDDDAEEDPHGGARIASTQTELDAMIADATQSTPVDIAAATTVPHASELDHVYPVEGEVQPMTTSSKSPPPLAVVFYGAVGTPCFYSFHATLKKAALEGKIKYVHRPVLVPGCERDGCVGLGATGGGGGGKEGGERLTVAGFGVEMAVKNMEYKATDDTKVKDAGGAGGAGGAGAASAELSSEDVKGFNFAKLAERYPDLTSELTSFRDHLVAMDSKDEAALKVWDIKDLGLQATQRIALANDPLQMMVDISQNFPSLASSLSRMELDQQVRKEVDNNQRRVPAGSIVMSLNGAPMELDTIDIFTLTDRVAAETRVARKFRSIGIDGDATRRLLRMQMASRDGEASTLRLNLSDPTVPKMLSFVNNIETDRHFKQWSKSVETLLAPGQMRQLPPVRRNLHNLVVVIDLGQSVSWTLIDMFQQYLQARVPLRIAYVLVDNGEGGPDSGKKRPRNPMAAMMGMAEDEDEDDYGSDGSTVKADPDLPEGLLIGSALARAGTLLLRRYNARAQGDFLMEVAAARPVIYPGNHFMPSVMGDATWKDAKAVFAKIFKRAYKNAAPKGEKKPTDDEIKKALQAAVADVLSSPGEASAKSESAGYVEETKASLERKGASAPAALVNGLYFSRQDAHAMGGELDQVVMHFIQQELQRVTQAVYEGKLTDKMLEEIPGGMYGWLHRTAVSKNTPFIVDQVKFPPKYVVMDAVPSPTPATTKVKEEMPLVSYTIGGNVTEFKGTTVWVVADAGTEEGARLIANAYDFVTSDSPAAKDARLALLHPPGAPPSPVSRAVAKVTRMLDPKKRVKAPRFIMTLLNHQPFSERHHGVAAGRALAAAALDTLCDEGCNKGDSMDIVMIDEILARQGEFAASKLGLKPPPSPAEQPDRSTVSPGAVIANGRMIEVPAGKTMDSEDFSLLISKESGARGDEVRDVIESMSSSSSSSPQTEDGKKDDDVLVAPATAEADSDRCMTAASIVATRQTSATSRGQVMSLESLESKHSAVVVPGDGAVMLEAVLDPLSKEAQRIAPVLVLLRDALAPHMGVRVILNPKLTLEDLPLKSYYRYAAPPTNLEQKPRVYFAQLPQHKTLTAHLDVPEMWLVTTAVAAYDLDNLKLEDLPEGQTTMHAEYRIEALLVTGHANEVGSREPPRGTQLTLGDAGAGTVVMSNLGYFQLPAAPGLFDLALRPGRSSEIYAISGPVVDVNVGGGGGGGREEGDDEEKKNIDPKPSSTEVFVASWQGRVVRLMLERRPGMEEEDVLDVDGGAGGALPESGSGGEGGGGGGIWGKMKSMFGGKKETAAAAVVEGDGVVPSANPKFNWQGETIHIFSVASGHLYERFLKIMMLSVRRNTKNPLKFWFIKNWLSPRFKDFLPHIAAEYGFEFELVTYKWPTWLNKQTEKQRIIWAYKLLFLDVLFPLTLNKVIFVDADQVVRADMKELWRMDLKGAPYAYTPFCDNNKEMEGYRFWKQGFWQSHLAGKPYHISALYVVDLARFRRTAAGDQLRVIYEQLSKDPNSLANLDQDLPNYAQHQVPIFSLPQQWLWCESWCGNQTKSAAKTIDLCNNPMTKEPKLKGAARIVKEWPALDAEVRGYTDTVEERLYGFKQVETPQEKAAREAAEKAAKEAAMTTTTTGAGSGSGGGGGGGGGGESEELKEGSSNKNKQRGDEDDDVETKAEL